MSINSVSQRARRAGGQPISLLMHKALAQPELISLAAGFVDPRACRSKRRSRRSTPCWPIPCGHAPRCNTAPRLDICRCAKRWSSSSLPRPMPASDAAGLSADQVVMTAGSNQMLHLLADTLFDPGDIVLCAAPTYFVYLGLLHNLGVRAVGVASDARRADSRGGRRGLRTSSSAAANCTASRRSTWSAISTIRAAHVVARAAAAVRRAGPALVERAHTIHVIEDAAYRELRLRRPRPAQPAVVRSRRRHGDLHPDVFQVVFAGPARGLGRAARSRWSGRSASRRATWISARRISPST